jgi:predicted nucleotidyltransferase component of viral defense system
VSRNLAASVQARLLNLARSSSRDYGQVLTRYALERLLYRLSISEHADHFLLKGALLFDLWFDMPLRPTRDIDLLGFGVSETPHLIGVFQDLCGLEVDDGMVFVADSLNAQEIRKAANYSGVRVTLRAQLGPSKASIQIDVGYGDAVTPAPEKAAYPVLLDEFAAPLLRVYPRETVVAEKLETIVLLGIANSRMKDYFDLWVLCKHTHGESSLLKQAIHATFQRRGTPLPKALPVGLSEEFALDTQKQQQWRAFLKKNRLDEVALQSVVEDLRLWLAPLLPYLID